MKRIWKGDLASLREIRSESRWIISEETGKPIEKSAYFSSMEAMLHGAFRFVEYFEQMHKEGKVYLGNSYEPFLFHLRSGSMVGEGNARFGLPGEGKRADLLMNEFAAPELIEEILANPETESLGYSMETDRYFVAVFLFEYFFHTGSPFEGKRMVNRCFLSPLEKEAYRVEENVFCMDIGENGNEPVKGIQDKLIKYWESYPMPLRKMFQKAFLDSGTICELRPTDVDWKQLLVQLAMDYKHCGCGFHGFSEMLLKNDNGTFACPKCNKTYYPLANGLERILLAEGEKLYACQTGRDAFDKETVTGIVVENRQHKGLYGIKNVSDGVWKGLYPDGKTKEIEKGQGIPIWNGMNIRFERGEDWTLRLITPVEEQYKELERVSALIESFENENPIE